MRLRLGWLVGRGDEMFDVSAGIGGEAVMDGVAIGYIIDLNTDPVGIIEATIRLIRAINYDNGMVCRIDSPDVLLHHETILPGAFVRINTGMPFYRHMKESSEVKAWLARWARR
jgi:hypothetical protein